MTLNAHDAPLAPAQTTLVVPIGNNEPDAGLQATVPQPVPLPDGVVNWTTFPHCAVSFTSVMSDGQLTALVAGEIVAEAVNVLSVSNNSAVSLVTVAVLVTAEPACAPALTWKTKVSCAVVLAGSDAIVQVELPVPPTDGFVQSNAGPVTWVSDWNVELVATVTVNETFCASLGPLFVTNTLNAAFELDDASNGAKIGHHRSTAG